MNDPTIATFQTRIPDDPNQAHILGSYAALFGKVERTLFAKYSAGFRIHSQKSSFLKLFGITARQFNGVRMQLEGKITSIRNRQPQLIQEHKERIKTLQKTIKKLEKKKDQRARLHQKKRRLLYLNHKLAKMESDKKSGTVRLCFGSKKRFRTQFAQEANGYHSLEEWKQDWQAQRASDFFVVGSKDETAGNQSCQAILEMDGTITLKVRLPNALVKQFGKYLIIPRLHFNWGHSDIVKSLEKGRAISYRFKRDKKGWLVFASTQREIPEVITKDELGTIGIDLNANHIALVETDRFGNPLQKKSIPLNTYGKRSHQGRALLGDASAQIIEIARRAKKPIVLEKLDFQKKKTRLKEHAGNKHARMLSSFFYNAFFTTLKSRAQRHGVGIAQVNPAYTSIIGRIKFAKRYGLTVHQAASLCIARRKNQFSEKPSSSPVSIPAGKEGHVTLQLPVRNRSEHVWTFWRRANRKVLAALAEHARAKRKTRSKDLPKANPCDSTLPGVVGEIPTGEPLAALLG